MSPCQVYGEIHEQPPISSNCLIYLLYPTKDSIRLIASSKLIIKQSVNKLADWGHAQSWSSPPTLINTSKNVQCTDLHCQLQTKMFQIQPSFFSRQLAFSLQFSAFILQFQHSAFSLSGSSKNLGQTDTQTHTHTQSVFIELLPQLKILFIFHWQKIFIVPFKISGVACFCQNINPCHLVTTTVCIAYIIMVLSVCLFCRNFKHGLPPDLLLQLSIQSQRVLTP